MYYHYPRSACYRQPSAVLQSGYYPINTSQFNEEPLQILPMKFQIYSVNYNPLDQSLAAGSYGEIIVWNPDGSIQTQIPQPEERITSVNFSSLDGSLASTGRRTIIWDPRTGTVLKNIPIVNGDSVCYSPDGRTLATSQEYGDVTIWDPITATKITSIYIVLPTSSVSFSPDGNTLVIGSQNPINHYRDRYGITLWNFRDGIIETIKTDIDVTAISYHPNGHTLAAGDDLGNVTIWKPNNKTLIKTFKSLGSIRSISYSPDGRTLIAASDDNIHIWDLETNNSQTIQAGSYFNYVNSVAFSPDGLRIAAGLYNGNVKIWEKQRISPVKGPNRYPYNPLLDRP